MMATGTQSEVVRLTVRIPSRDLAERMMAEAWEFGALGIEERDQGPGVDLDLYVAAQKTPVWVRVACTRRPSRPSL